MGDLSVLSLEVIICIDYTAHKNDHFLLRGYISSLFLPYSLKIKHRKCNILLIK